MAILSLEAGSMYYVGGVSAPHRVGCVSAAGWRRIHRYGIKDEMSNASHAVKGGVEEAAGDVAGKDDLAQKGQDEVTEAAERQAEEVEHQAAQEEGESPAEPHSTAESILHADGR
jgi:uncharacterized protein YjbJ (UPF0337 family)